MYMGIYTYVSYNKVFICCFHNFIISVAEQRYQQQFSTAPLH